MIHPFWRVSPKMSPTGHVFVSEVHAAGPVEAQSMLIDSHAHLEDPRFADDRDDVLARAWDTGVRTILTIGNGDGPDDMGCGLPIAERHDWIFTSVGVHPHDAGRVRSGHLTLMGQLAGRERVVAIGETGLDYYYDNAPRHRQVEVFRAQLDLAVRLDMPVIIHTRDADEDTIALLRQVRPQRGVVHCFTGGPRLAECALDLGLMISFSGIVTFRTAGPIREIAEGVPGDRLLVETDAPYLAPVPHRGKRNEPAFIVETAAALAGIRGATLAELGAQTSRNFAELFGIGG
jgi:TatD DNase family protein